MTTKYLKAALNRKSSLCPFDAYLESQLARGDIVMVQNLNDRNLSYSVDSPDDKTTKGK